MESHTYKTINRELTMKVQSLQMQLAELRGENVQLNSDLLQSRKKMHNLKTVIMATFDTNIKGYNHIATALLHDAPHTTGSEPNTPLVRPARRINSNGHAYQPSTQRQLCDEAAVAQTSKLTFSRQSAPKPKPTPIETDDDDTSIAHEESTIKNVSGHTNDLTDASMNEDNANELHPPVTTTIRSTSVMPMPVRVSALSPPPNTADEEAAEDRGHQSMANVNSPSLMMRLHTIAENSEDEEDASSSSHHNMTDQSVVNTPSLISSNVSLRRGNPNQRKKSSFFFDQESEWQQNESAILHSIDDFRNNLTSSLTMLATPDGTAPPRSSNPVGLCNTPQLAPRRPISRQDAPSADAELNATPHLPGKHLTVRVLNDLTNVHNSMASPKHLAVHADPSAELDDLSDLYHMGGATCSTPNPRAVSIDSFGVDSLAITEQHTTQKTQRYRMLTRKSSAAMMASLNATASTSSSPSYSTSNTNKNQPTTRSQQTSVSSQRSVDNADSATAERRPKRKAAPVMLREAPINVKMRNLSAKPTQKRK